MIPTSYFSLIINAVSNPTGRWADFGPVHYYWEHLCELVKMGVLDPAALPDEPVPSDYTDFDSPRTEGYEVPSDLRIHAIP